MTTQHFPQPNKRYSNHCENQSRNRYLWGGIIIAIGAFILAKRLGILVFPFHVWPLILVAIGIFSGVKHQFRNLGSWVLIALGILFTIPRFWVFGVLSTHLVAPVLLIVLGTYLVLRPSGRFRKTKDLALMPTDEDQLYIDVSFAERNEIVTSKQFKGGTVNNSFSETRLNLLQADSTETMQLDLKVSFGTVEILVPSHWEVDFQVSNSFANIEDKRLFPVVASESKRTLVLKGSCTFGSVTVKSL